jgi:DNA gyrase subunit A
MATAIVEQVPLHQAAAERYLNYALSVITSRALPDVRDGLKPVQRRILFTMFHEMRLHPGGRYRKCAAVVGEVMGKYHPHGDQSIYDALVRMAQDFSLLAPLVDGQGNFGSIDGDPPAAMRYTECKLRPLAEELLSEIKMRTVDWRPNYDGQRSEPIVLPATFPNLLVNGSEGIAVGMATRIPPHNLGEVVDAAIALIGNRKLPAEELVGIVRGPDFPTGGEILAGHSDLLELYTTGKGTLKVRATWSVDKDGRRKQIIIDSVPYGQNKAKLIEHVGAEVRDKKLPQVVDVRDESTDDVRIVLDLKQGASPEAVMAYLFKRTALSTSWPVNLTALIPSDKPDVCTPSRLDLKSILLHWLDFRFATVRRRFEYELAVLEERIHILEGFQLVFDALDEAIAIIRASEGKRDAADRLMDRFDLDDVQTDAILELRLYKLAKLEILVILEELEEKRAEAARIESILASDRKLWNVVRKELKEVRQHYAVPRRTRVGLPEKKLEFDEDAYIVKEDTYCVVTRDGWIKRQSSFSAVDKIRVRDGDEIGWLFKAHTRSTVTFFTNLGSAYVMRVDDVPSTTGYGDPLQASFSFADGERVVGVASHDARHRKHLQETLLQGAGDDPPPPYGIALTLQGRVLRFPLATHEDVSTKNGRKYARLGKGDQVFAVYVCDGDERVCAATKQGRAIVFDGAEVPILKAAGKGVTGIKTRDGDEVMAFELARGSLDGPTVVTSFGRELVVRERKFGLSKRGGRGKVVLKRGTIDSWQRGAILRLDEGADTSVAPSHDDDLDGEE